MRVLSVMASPMVTLLVAIGVSRSASQLKDSVGSNLHDSKRRKPDKAMDTVMSRYFNGLDLVRNLVYNVLLGNIVYVECWIIPILKSYGQDNAKK